MISAEEIANASAALKALLKNGSDHLTRDDLRPARGPRRPVADETGGPRRENRDFRPNDPRSRDRENAANEPAGRRRHQPMRERGRDEWASADFDRPHQRHEPMGERRRFARLEDGDRSDERPRFQDERPGRHERPARRERETDNDERPQFRHEFGGWREHFVRADDRMMDRGERPRFRPERLSRHERPDGQESETSDAMRPRHRPEPAGREQEVRSHRGPREADARTEGPAQFRRQGQVREPGGPEGEHHGPPASPLFDALDANHDGTISADEIGNAPAALKALLKNGSDRLTRDDLRATMPPTPTP